MARKRNGLGPILRRVSRGREHSPLFWWMYEHHDELLAASKGRRLWWDDLSKDFGELGLTDATGKRSSPRTAKRTWERVRQYVARERAAKEAKPVPIGGRYPSRYPANWRPEPVRQSGSGGTSLAAKEGGSDSQHGSKGLSVKEEGMLSLLAVKRDLARISGRNPDDVK